MNIALIAIGLLSLGSAQATRVGFIDFQEILSIHDVYDELVEKEEAARAELDSLGQTYAQLEQKRAENALTAEDEEMFTLVTSSLDSLSLRYEEELNALLNIAIEDIQAAVRQVAMDLEISAVFDYAAAFNSGGLFYADPDLDITERVINEMLGIGGAE